MTGNEGQHYRFSEAPIWELQRAYYEEQGLKAWNNDQVPQYITSNPVIATAYAEMIFGFLQDRAGQGHLSETVTILELGAGAGRLAYHILKKLCEIIDYAGTPLPPFRYVMSDLPAKNITSWQQHPSLLPFVEQGILDFARFDAVQDTELYLVKAKLSIKPGDLQQPLLLVANYFFDSIPQELIYVDEGKIFECEVSIQYSADADSDNPSDILGKIIPQYHYRRAANYEAETYTYHDVIALYQQKLEDSHILFPVVGLTCLERLARLSKEGFVLLTADKGDHRIENWEFAEPPELIHHGSFSLTANYHAIQHVLEQKGAQSLFTTHHYKNLNIGCILMLDAPMSYTNTRLGYKRFVERFGPDDFFSMKEWGDHQLDAMEIQQILVFWRLGGYDAEWFIHSAERISELLPTASDEEMLDLQQGIRLMWTGYYPMEQSYDLSLDAGLLLYEMDKFEEALAYLERSMHVNSEEPLASVLYSMAICNYELGAEGAALDYARRAFAVEPDNEVVLELITALSED
ncbi:SAM-dependent methyltransferase [Paenibacillus sp. B2(2019)]|uniref:SAM-dependent methyltransferase n=1 Tax=Paenibacillus sp. B2(2019) TaxID=2607754 RepID=UPI0011F11B15|nr:SAM-dependent methyltransferase [Paenibacillus sp. B2(2019)]KAA1188696.1 tetratricopeptide repeat protein [Paenibacillus sp. B2(2019)]